MPDVGGQFGRVRSLPECIPSMNTQWHTWLRISSTRVFQVVQICQHRFIIMTQWGWCCRAFQSFEAICLQSQTRLLAHVRTYVSKRQMTCGCMIRVLVLAHTNHSSMTLNPTGTATFQPPNRLVLLLAANVHISIVMWRVRTGCVGAGARLALKMIKLVRCREVSILSRWSCGFSWNPSIGPFMFQDRDYPGCFAPVALAPPHTQSLPKPLTIANQWDISLMWLSVFSFCQVHYQSGNVWELCVVLAALAGVVVKEIR